MMLKKLYNRTVIQSATILVLLILAFSLDTPKAIFEGYWRILTKESLLLTDYFAIGGIGATFFNVATILLVNFLLINVLKIKFSGPVVAGLFTIAGFAFFGKTAINTLPIYLGIYLYSLYSKVEFKNYIIVALFSTGIGPLVSFFWFGTPWALGIRIPLGIVVGVIVGFFLQIIATNAMKFHRGYNLYNIGFTLGLIAVVFTGLFRMLKMDLNTSVLVENSYSTTMFIILLTFFVLLMACSSYSSKDLNEQLKGLTKRTGRLVSDFIKETSIPAVCFNMSSLGLLTLLVIAIFSIPINGPIVGGILTVVGFGAFGKHIKNVIPVMGGAILASFVFGLDLTKGEGVAVGILFVTALAPIAGHYGILAGLIAGFMHMLILPMAFDFQGGFDLYNNGFAAGFVAAILVPIFDVLSSKGEGLNV